MRLGDWTGVADYGDRDREYQAARSGVGLCDRSHRGLLEITGADRTTWLHNLITNGIKELAPGDGRYAFALNVKGRILFDMNVLILRESIRLDIDVRWIADALAHFERYAIVEDVALVDRTDAYLRLALIGPGAGRLMARLGVSNAPAVPLWQTGSHRIGDTLVTFFRHDLCGVDTIDLLVPGAAAGSVRAALRACDEVAPVGYDAVDTLRIEGGVPWPFSEIDASVLPAETRQLDRAVSFSKGCYLGQEIVARMMSRRSVARQLVSMGFEGERAPPVGAKLDDGDLEIGRVTSACASPLHGCPVGLGYVRTDRCAEGAAVRAVWDGGCAKGRVLPTPSADGS